MIQTTDAYKAAVTGVTRRTRLRVPVRVVSPDLVYGGLVYPPQAPWSRPGEVPGGESAAARYATLEPNRWVLDGSMGFLSDDGGTAPGRAGYVSEEICNEDGWWSFSPAYYNPSYITIDRVFRLPVSGIPALRAVSVLFSDLPQDGVARSFTVRVYAGGRVAHRGDVRNNTARAVLVDGFTVYDPETITVTVYQWSIPNRRLRIMGIVPGYGADWTEENVTSLSVTMRGAADGLTLPYGTASVTFDNRDKLFDARNKAGLFESLEERQAVPVRLGVERPDGTTEYVPVGTYYRHDLAWSTGDSGMTITWELVDVIGLLTGRSFTAPAAIPTTLAGWTEALLAQLGEAFRGRYHVDGSLAAMTLTASRADVDGKPCGDILRWLCQASGAFPRARSADGYLTLEPLWSQGGQYTLDDLEDAPEIRANDSLGELTFSLPEGECVISGNTAATADTATVRNPFLTTREAALETARRILTACGGSKYSAVGRGDPSWEIGDVVTLSLAQGAAVTGRLMRQTLKYDRGVLRGCISELLQADGESLYENREVITAGGTWTAPAGVSELRVILVGGGQSGGHGKPGEAASANLFHVRAGTIYGTTGASGTAGQGGKVWYGTVSVNPGQSYPITVGAGGTAGTTNDAEPVDGGDTTFGSFSSASGKRYSPCFTDVASGNAYGRAGIYAPLAGSGDGGAGGAGGDGGSETWEAMESGGWRRVSATGRTYGEPGRDGASGCVVICWSKEATA